MTSEFTMRGRTGVAGGTWRRRVGAATSALLLMAAACDGGGTPDRGSRGVNGETSTSGSDAAAAVATHFVLLDHPGWELKEAVDYRVGIGAMGELDPDLDWYAEYDGPRVDHGDGSFTIPAITISGHTAGLEERGDHLPGFEFRSEDMGGRRVLAAAPSGGNPGVVLLELTADYSVMVLSYDEGVDLRDLAARLTPVDERQWIAAGGKMIDCVPSEPGCVLDD